MLIAYLADYPQHVPTVASWIYEQWGHRDPGNSLPETIARYRTYMQRDSVPLSLIAVSDDGEPLGTASLWYQGQALGRPQLSSPWLAAVYVVPERRQRGVGSALVQAAERAARELDIPRLYLFTPDREHFYARLGWDVLEHLNYHNEPVVIMHRALNGNRKEEE